MFWPSLQETKYAMVTSSMLSVMNVILPSRNDAFTPPRWRLRGAAESQPES